MIITPNRCTKLLSLLLLFTTHNVMPAQSRDPEFNRFWRRFRTAVVKNDKEAIASMTKFPFLYDSKERSRAEFMKVQNKLFTRRVRRCFATAKPLTENEAYDVFCGGLIFFFGKSHGEFKLLEFGADD